MTRAQERALEQLWPRYGLQADDASDLDRVFARCAPRFLEIGFGMGDALAAMASQRPQHDFLGIDVHDAGIGRALMLLEEAGAANARVLRGDAVELLAAHLPPASLDGIMVFFPDPWPKKRHHKRRLIQPEFAASMATALVAGGVVHLATDWEPYAHHMLATLEAESRFTNLHRAEGFAPSRAERPATRFERRGERLGHSIFDLRYVRER